MNNFSVKQQLSFAFGTLAVLVLVVSFLALRGLGNSNERFTTYVNGAAYRETLVESVRAAADQRAMAVRNLVLVKTAADKELERSVAVKSHTEVQERLKALKDAVAAASDATERDRFLVEQIEKVESVYGPVALSIVQLALDDKTAAAIDKMNAECRPLLAALLTAGRDYLAYSEEQAKHNVAEAAGSFGNQRSLLLFVSGLAVLGAALLGWLITRRLVASLGAEPAELSHVVQLVAKGDLNPIPGSDAAPAGSVLASIGAMQRQLVSLIGQVRSSAESIATASAQIAEGNQDLSGRTEEQASALEETAASMEELSSTVRQNADNSRQADQLAQGASTVAVKGGKVVGQVVETMRDINDSSNKIAEIIGVIDGIAFQTNILALNAAVEAARAGEQGRGFAVVAAEVRSLAQRSADAAKEIKTLITASVERVEHGSKLVDHAGTTMTEVVESIKRVTDLMSEISAASVEQSTGVAQVGEAVTQMDRTTQQNAALVEQSAAAAESLTVQARQLVQAVAVFKLAQGASSTVSQPRAVAAETQVTSPAAQQERRGPNRAKNVSRLKPKAQSQASTKVAGAGIESHTRTGTDDDWTSF